ncbi:MAG: nuclear transport factor 2 family protein [Opitutae bacterium]|nr:nuclear transport factor 2 family protein [Opitutae bacterium]
MKLPPLVVLVPALACAALSLRGAEKPLSLHDAAARFHAATAENLPAAYRAAFADDGILMFLHARGRAELDAAIAHRMSPTAKFTATPAEEIEAASHDLGFVRGDYRLEFTRKTTGEHLTTNGRFVELWKKNAAGEWQLWLTSWAGGQAPDANAMPLDLPDTPPELRGTLADAEQHFLQQAATDGIRPAFLAHLAEDATILFLDAHGREAIRRAVNKIPADAHTFGEAAVLVESAAHDLGWAWGPYRFAATVDGKPFESHGKFITVWKRSPIDGSWRIALDHGAQDPAPPTPAPAAPKKS